MKNTELLHAKLDGFPPAKKNERGKAKNGFLFVPQHIKAWEQSTAWILRTMLQRPIPEKAHFQVQIEICVPDHRRRDLDNMVTSLLDAMNVGLLGFDDSRVTTIGATKCVGDEPYTEVWLWTE